MPVPAPRLAATALAGIAALALAACGSGSSSSTSSSSAATSTPATTTAAAAAATSTVKLTADPNGALKFNTDTLTAKAGTVTVEMLNPSGSGLPHGIAVEGNGVDQDGKTVQPGGTSTDTLKLKPGTDSFYCPVRGHKAGGMKGTLTVT